MLNISTNTQNLDNTLTNQSQPKQQDLVKETPIEKNQEDIKKLSKDEIKTTKQIINILNESSNSQLKFGFNDEVGMSTIQVYDRDSDKLIREFPSKEFFNRLMFFRDNILPGLIMDEKA